jgi:hypothetical protein
MNAEKRDESSPHPCLQEFYSRVDARAVIGDNHRLFRALYVLRHDQPLVHQQLLGDLFCRHGGEESDGRAQGDDLDVCESAVPVVDAERFIVGIDIFGLLTGSAK